jgi:hypothetical protein
MGATQTRQSVAMDEKMELLGAFTVTQRGSGKGWQKDLRSSY